MVTLRLDCIEVPLDGRSYQAAKNYAVILSYRIGRHRLWHQNLAKYRFLSKYLN